MTLNKKANRYDVVADCSLSGSTLQPNLELSALNLTITERRIYKLYSHAKNRKSPRDRVIEAGLDADDVYSSILLGLCTRFNHTSGFNADRGMKETTYVYMVISSIVNNAIAASNRKKRKQFILGERCDVALTAEEQEEYNPFENEYEYTNDALADLDEYYEERFEFFGDI